MSKAVVIIPARYASSRFPGKPLAEIGGMSMIQRVVGQAERATGVMEVIVATDDERIAAHVTSFGGTVEMTSPTHLSGTDRLAEVVGRLESSPSVIVNVQGDEPFILPEQIDALIALFEEDSVDIGTLVTPIKEKAVLQDVDRVKCVRASDGRALYFSRAAVPHDRDSNGGADPLLHLGMYAYRPAVLTAIAALPPSPLELMESLEQLRWLENGYNIHTAITTHASIGIDRPEDVMRAEAYLAGKN